MDIQEKQRLLDKALKNSRKRKHDQIIIKFENGKKAVKLTTGERLDKIKL